MSLRRKLTLFFVAAVAIPVTLLVVLVVWVSGESSAKQADAQLQASLETATSVYRQAQLAAPGEAQRIASLAEPAVEAGDRAALRALAESEAEDPEIAAVTIRDADGGVLAAAGPKRTLAAGSSPIRGPDGPIGVVDVGILSTQSYLDRVESLTAGDAGLVEADAVVGTSVPLDPEQVPAGGEPFDVETAHDTARAATAGLPGEGGTRVVLIASASSEPLGSVPLMAAALLVFLLVALLLLFLLLRGLRGRLAEMLAAARRIGSGDFSRGVPLEGADEMTDLAREINRMSSQISSQVEELENQRRRLDESVRRLGDAIASGLDREALLAIAIETVVEACNADCGRVVLPDADGTTQRILTTSDPAHLAAVLARAVEEASGRQLPAVVNSANYHAIGQAMIEGDGPGEILCTMAVARSGPPFTATEAQALTYLIGQTRTSIENIELHEVVARQAVTDDLTGISNRRHFVDWIEREMARMDRFEGELSLVMVDIDDFKTVNDSRGHLHGDLVLVAIADVLREESRGIDEVARFGGEEFVVGLPGTPHEGAVELAERLRQRIEAIDVRPDDDGGPIAVTASFGVATAPADGSTERRLIAAADRALYQAKRRGKNRVATVPADGDGAAQGN